MKNYEEMDLNEKRSVLGDVFGLYNKFEEFEQAFNNLPEDLKERLNNEFNEENKPSNAIHHLSIIVSDLYHIAEEYYEDVFEKKDEEKNIEPNSDLENAFTTEVKYWLQALADDNSNDEIGKKALSILDNEEKIKEITDELVNGSDDMWEEIHTTIEHLAGIDYRNSTRVNESEDDVR